MKNRDADSQGAVRQHEPGDILGWANKITLAAEAFLEVMAAALEEMNIFASLPANWRWARAR